MCGVAYLTQWVELDSRKFMPVSRQDVSGTVCSAEKRCKRPRVRLILVRPGRGEGTDVTMIRMSSFYRPGKTCVGPGYMTQTIECAFDALSQATLIRYSTDFCLASFSDSCVSRKGVA